MKNQKLQININNQVPNIFTIWCVMLGDFKPEVC